MTEEFRNLQLAEVEAAAAVDTGIGTAEVAAGAATGIITASAFASISGPNPNAIMTEQDMAAKIKAALLEKSKALEPQLTKEFSALKPMPSEKAALNTWMGELHQYMDNSQAMKDLIRTETEKHFKDFLAAEKNAAKAMNASLWEKPLIAFNSMSVTGKIGVGVVALASALGAGYLVNCWRCSKAHHAKQPPSNSHAHQLETQRAQPQFRTLSDIM